MRAIVQFCLRFRVLVLLAAAALGVVGVLSLFTARYDVFPEYGAPTVRIDTEATGLAPRQIESLVTRPIEYAVNGIPGLAVLRSQSVEGLSVVSAVFHGDTDVYRDQQLVAQRLAPITKALPPGALPVIAPLQSATGTAMNLGLSSAKLALTELTRSTIRPALLAVPGVSKVVIFGAEPEQLQVQFDPKKLIGLDIGLNQLTAATAAASAVRGAGVVDTPNQRFVLTSHGQAPTPAALSGSLVLRRDGINVTLGEIAHVTKGSPPPVGGA